jgi:putative transposase
LESTGVRVGTDRVGRRYHNILVERFWRSVKFEESYPKRAVRDGAELEEALTAYFAFDNGVRPDKPLWYSTSTLVHEER